MCFNHVTLFYNWIFFLLEFFLQSFSPDDVWKIIDESTWEYFFFYVNNARINNFNYKLWITLIICVFPVVCWWNFGVIIIAFILWTYNNCLPLAMLTCRSYARLHRLHSLTFTKIKNYCVFIIILFKNLNLCHNLIGKFNFVGFQSSSTAGRNQIAVFMLPDVQF